MRRTENEAQREQQRKNWEAFEEVSRPRVFRRLVAIHAECPKLTITQVRLIVLAEEGFDTWRIAEMLCVNYHTVENYGTRIRKKLGVTSEIPLSQLFPKEL